MNIILIFFIFLLYLNFILAIKIPIHQLKCISWRQTINCNPLSKRDELYDKVLIFILKGM